MTHSGFPNVCKHMASSTGLAWAVPLLKAVLGEGGYYFSWERSRALG